MDMRDKTCCFTGHRRLPKGEVEQIKQQTSLYIKELIEQGVCYFGAGGALGFDTIAAQCVLLAKCSYPHIKLILILPCENQTRGWQQKDIDIYEDIKKKADKVVYTSRQYYDGCMLKRNRHMVDNSGYCLCYYNGNSHSGTGYTVRYATEQGLTVINLFK